MIIGGKKVSREIYQTLIAYQELLVKWNKSINLISKTSEQNIWNRHIADSFQLLRYINFTDKVLDIGSGAGLPGVILSIGGIKNTILIESDTRKCVFLKQASKLSNNEINILNVRVENSFVGECDVLVSRGVSSLNYILKFTQKIKVRKKILLLKGENYGKEIDEANKHWLFNLTVYDSLTSDKGKILELTNIEKP